MAVVIDASSPAITDGSGTSPLTSASFTPPAGSLVVAVACAGWSNNVTATIALSDSLSGSWTSRVTSNDISGTSSGCVQISTRVIGSSAAMTVTATYTNNSGGRMLGVYVMTGVETSTVGASAVKALVNGTSMTKSLTTTVTGSLVLGGVDSSGNPAIASLASNTAWAPMSGTNPVNQGTDFVSYGIIKGSSTTGTPGATTFGVTWSASTYGQMALLEIKPAVVQNIAAADSSSPAANNAVVQANITGADTGAGTEAAGIAVGISVTDTGSAVDAVSKITIPVAEAAIGDEANKVFTGGPIFAFGSDVITASESAPILVAGAADAMAHTEVAAGALNGPLPPGPRIVRIEAD